MITAGGLRYKATGALRSTNVFFLRVHMKKMRQKCTDAHASATPAFVHTLAMA